MFIISHTNTPRFALPIKNIERIFIHQEHEKWFEVLAELANKNRVLGDFSSWEDANIYFTEICNQINGA